ncbi:hypothetical protein [Conexibacter arvalis]|uniref:Uncharacterized protein n=1 Tax=Conexibacter arvalis TaxID=912552 RepID=A0A840IBZ7_9ACTN|nr:hypothetical protein [Conexibacter arvalis]MBB4661624.1 hypothetical protein [Conexibacter arvalis]
MRNATAVAGKEAWKRRWLLLAAATLLAITASAVPAAGAGFGITRFDGDVVNRDALGVVTAATQAGSHPDEVTAYIDFATRSGALPGLVVPEEDAKDIRVDLPVGFVGNPQVVTKCREPELESVQIGTDCPRDSQVGVAHVITTSTAPQTVPVFNMEPPPGVPGAFGFRIASVPIHLRAVVRSDGDYGLSILVPRLSQAAPILRTSLTFWGVPADPKNDADRGWVVDSGTRVVCADTSDPSCSTTSGLPPQAFLTNPMTCNGPVETRLSVTSWLGSSAHASFFTHLPAPDQETLVGPEGCDRVPFDARLTGTPVKARASSPSGFSFDLSVPQNGNPTGIAQGHLKKAVVRLPEGMSVNPSSASGLAACGDAQIGLGTLQMPSCPDGSKIGTLTIDTPLLSDPLTGAIYLRDPLPGNLFRLLLVAEGSGVLIKLPGTVTPDPVTGQLTATFDNNPQLPFSNLHLEFKDGPRAPLTLPPACGTHTIVSDLTSWSGKTTTSSSSFNVSRDGNGAPCPPRGFNPTVVAGLANPVGGSSSAFSLTFARGDADQTLRDITVDMPEGLTGVIASADLCDDAAANAGTCGESSRIGSTTTGAGTGENPFFLPGRVYITGPYKGAPFGMSIVVPAIAGPFNLGTVVVRAAIFVDRETAKLRVVSEPLPTILEGVPLLIRTVNVRIDKPGFMVAPTSCAPKSIAARVGSNEGASADRSVRFQVGSCASLPYKPKMTIRMGKRGRTKGRITAPLEVRLDMTPGQANNKSVAVTLPRNVNARLEVLNRYSCTLEQFKSETCPKSNRLGTAVAVTPLLRDPLVGDVFFVRNPARRIPDVMVGLRGQVAFDLAGRVTIPRNLTLRTNFDLVPDVPITKFTLRFVAGRKGPVGFVENACTKAARRERAKLVFRAHSGKVVRVQQRLKIVGCGRRAVTRARGRRGARRGGKAKKGRRGAAKRK